MKEIIETIILNLVDNKEAVTINEVEGAKSIRTVVKSIGARDHKKVTVEFID